MGTGPRQVDHGRDIEVQIPKLRRLRLPVALSGAAASIKRALHAEIMEAYTGYRRAAFDDLRPRWACRPGVSKSEVSRIRAGLDTEIEGAWTRSLTYTEFPYVFYDATFCKVRVGAHVVSFRFWWWPPVPIDGTREVS